MRRLVPVLLLTVVMGCGSGSSGSSGDRGGDPVTLRVLAAASLTESFTELGKLFEAEHPGTVVELNFGPSSGLAAQIGNGAPADVFASASPTNMATVVSSDDANDPQDFATNSMGIAVPADNPGSIASLDDLTGEDVKVAVCQAQVPCGKAAAEVFAKARITVQPVTEEVDVKSVLTKVSLGEVDAGVVYVSDLLASGEEVKGIEIPDAVNTTTTYPIATLTGTKHPRTADEFVALVLSDAGAKVLRDAGFQQP